MQIPQREFESTTRYIDNLRDVTPQDKEPELEWMFDLVRRVRPIDSNTRILEIGPGIGWIPILCQLKGIRCKGLEINPQLVEYAKEFGKKHGVEPDIELGNIEDTDLGESEYDLIIASSVFEHVEYWRQGLQKIYTALKPGGALFFSSTNKFCLKSGEHSFPLYGWFPNWFRYRLRVARQGPDVMKVGIDFHEFTYPMLRRAFRKLGFSVVLDRIDLLDPDNLKNPKPWKIFCLKLCRRFKPLKHLALCFVNTTRFVCVK